MAVKMRTDLADAIVDEFRAGTSITDISSKFLLPATKISRLLAYRGEHTLSNYKTKEEFEMLKSLYARNIKTRKALLELLNKVK